MTNFANRNVYLTTLGSKQFFGKPDFEGLPVVPTDPTDVDGTLVYGNTYAFYNGQYIGGCISQDAFTDIEPAEIDLGSVVVSSEQIKGETHEAYCAHHADIVARYGDRGKPDADIDALLATPQGPIPKLREKMLYQPAVAPSDESTDTQ